MNAPKPLYRKRRLFPRSLQEVVQAATKPMMDKQGKLYSALLRDWAVIVGDARAAICAPMRLQFPTEEVSGAILHLNVHPAHTAELPYVTAQLLEQCARYFGYRAIERIVLHSDYTKLTPDQHTPNAAITPNPSAKNETLELLKAWKSAVRNSDGEKS